MRGRGLSVRGRLIRRCRVASRGPAVRHSLLYMAPVSNYSPSIRWAGVCLPVVGESAWCHTVRAVGRWVRHYAGCWFGRAGRWVTGAGRGRYAWLSGSVCRYRGEVASG